MVRPAGSGSAASSAALASAAPAMKETILAYAATSNLLTGITGMYSVVFIALPFNNWLYRRLQPIIQKNDSSARNRG